MSFSLEGGMRDLVAGRGNHALLRATLTYRCPRADRGEKAVLIGSLANTAAQE
jgi:hypothetical protein